MAGLVAEKTWGKIDYGSYIRGASADTSNRLLMYWIKHALLRTYDDSGDGGAGSWEVVGSSDSSAASMDGTDRWTDYTKLVWASSGAHSWIVLKQTGISSADQGFQICIDCLRPSSNTEYCTITTSFSAGFAGGDTSNRPTATDEVVLHSDAIWGGSATNYYWRLIVCKSSDGACTRVFMSYNGTFLAMWMLDRPKSPPAAWTTPFVGRVYINPTYANIHNASNLYVIVNGGRRDVFATCECDSAGALTENTYFQRPDYSGNWLTLPMGIAVDNANIRAQLGRIYDLWFIPTALPNYEYLRGSGDPYSFVVVSDVLQPFDGTPFNL